MKSDGSWASPDTQFLPTTPGMDHENQSSPRAIRGRDPRDRIRRPRRQYAGAEHHTGGHRQREQRPPAEQLRQDSVPGRRRRQLESDAGREIRGSRRQLSPGQDCRCTGGRGRQGGRRTTPEPGDDRDTKVGTVTRKSDAGPAVSQPDRTVGSQPDAGPATSQPDRTVGSQPGTGPAVVSIQPGDDKGGLSTFPEQGSDQGGQRKASEPGDDSGGHGSDD
jgi:hypothetical protein